MQEEPFELKTVKKEQPSKKIEEADRDDKIDKLNSIRPKTKNPYETKLDTEDLSVKQT